MLFREKVALITGGAAGFGRSFAESLASEGARIVLLDIDETQNQRTAEILTAYGADCLPLSCDVSDEEGVNRCVELAAKAYGKIDILINNAGLHLSEYNKSFEELGSRAVRRLFDVNMMGVIHLSLACKKYLAIGKGNILNISSISSIQPVSPYGVSKLCVRGLTIAFATQFAASGIRVNSLSPGLIDTVSAMQDLPQEIIRLCRDELQLIKRTGNTLDVVNAMLYLCSDRASFVTGENLTISGGYPLAI